jgi:hypothetical protein
MVETTFDGTCQIFPDEKDELDVLPEEESALTTPKEKSSKNKIEML